MRAFFTLWRKELASYFLSPIAYVVTIFFLVTMGYIFWFLCSVLADGAAATGVLALFFASPFFWMVMLVIVPVLTMRLLAEEKRAGTIETLLCAPVSDAAVVLAKYAGVLAFYVFMWLPTISYVFVLKHFSSVMAPIDWGPLAGGYLGALMVGALYLAIGVLCSAVTSNQIIAAVLCFAAIGVLFFSGFLEYIGHSDTARAVGSYISSYSHMYDLSRGAVDSRPFVFCLSGVALALFAAVKVVESRQWK
jgi:ABC-2 type transport system permease protein